MAFDFFGYASVEFMSNFRFYGFTTVSLGVFAFVIYRVKKKGFIKSMEENFEHEI